MYKVGNWLRDRREVGRKEVYSSPILFGSALTNTFVLSACPLLRFYVVYLGDRNENKNS